MILSNMFFNLGDRTLAGDPVVEILDGEPPVVDTILLHRVEPVHDRIGSAIGDLTLGPAPGGLAEVPRTTAVGG